MNKTKVGLVQVNNSFSNQNYFPYSVGILQAYAQKYLSSINEFEFLIPIYKRLLIKDALKHLKGADIVFFSAYTWNINISLRIAKELKKVRKDILIVFGGPQVPLENNKSFLTANKFVDIACHGEGEQAFLKILENFNSKDRSSIPNISYLNAGRLVQNRIGIRTDMADIPSPYITGAFAPLMKANPKENWVALWETNRGCPFSCSYCIWGASTNKKVYSRNLEELYSEIDWFSKNKIEFIFCCDANFGILPRDQQLVERVAQNRLKCGYPKALSVQNTKNSTMRVYNIYKTMSDAKLNKGVSLAMQSTNPATLKSIKRENISLESFQELQEKFSYSGIETFTDVILGLPRETYSSFTEGVSKIISNGQHNRIQFNNLTILTGSEMDNPAYLKKYGMKTVKNDLINIHGSLSEKNEVRENQKMVIATKAMPAKDWLKARAFGWMTALMHFDKLAQIPLILINKECGISYRDIIESLMNAGKKYPVLSSIVQTFRKQAEIIQKGDPEFARSEKYLNIWWPVDELVMIKLSTEGKMDAFYGELEKILKSLLPAKKQELGEAITNAIELNKKLIKMPFNKENLEVELKYNILEYYRAVLCGSKAELKMENFTYSIDRTSQQWDSWENWCREVIWYGNKRGAYLYPCQNTLEEIK